MSQKNEAANIIFIESRVEFFHIEVNILLSIEVGSVILKLFPKKLELKGAKANIINSLSSTK